MTIALCATLGMALSAVPTDKKLATFNNPLLDDLTMTARVDVLDVATENGWTIESWAPGEIELRRIPNVLEN